MRPAAYAYLEVGDDGLLCYRLRFSIRKPRQPFQIELRDMSKPYGREATSA